MGGTPTYAMHIRDTVCNVGRFERPYCFLGKLYDLESFYRMKASMMVEINGIKRRLRAVYSTDEDAALYTPYFKRFSNGNKTPDKVYCINDPDVSDYVNEKVFADLEEAGEYREYFAKLDSAVEAERRKMYDFLGDSRNYRRRISARVIDNEMHAFCETYNFDVPEAGEYFLMDYCRGRYSFTVSDRSRFMRLYMPEDKYKQVYGDAPDKVLESYNSTSEIYYAAAETAEGAEFGAMDKGERMAWRIFAFRKMKREIKKLIRRLKTGRAHICNKNVFNTGEARKKYAMARNVIRYYEAKKAFMAAIGIEWDEEDDFNCYSNEEELRDCYKASKVKAEFTLPDGRKFSLDGKDLLKSFELGLEDIGDIGRFLLRYGSLRIRDCL